MKFYGTTDTPLVMEIASYRQRYSYYSRHEVGELLSWSEAEQKFSLNRAQILDWLGLLNCIPKAWKNKLAANSERLCSALNTKQTPFITSKTAYQILLKSLVRQAMAQSSLENS